MTAAGNGRATPLGPLGRAHVLLRGIDSTADSAGPSAVGPLPVGELLHPGALLAVAVLVANDWWAKRAYPGWLTGKLSDVAGLVMAPLALSAAIGCALWLAAQVGARLGRAPAGADPAERRRGAPRWSIDCSARPRRFALALALTAAVFTATKLSATAASLVVSALALCGFPASRIVVDPTDLLALPALWCAAAIARAELRLVARGRVHAILRGARSLDERVFADALAAGASPTHVEALRLAVAARDLASIDDALRQIAGASPHRH